MTKQTYDIDGMVCAACSSAVEKVTKKLTGVKSSNVNLTTKQLSIEYDESQCTVEQICSAVQKAGFKISLRDENSFTEKPSNKNKSSKEKIKKENLHSQKRQLILIWITSLFLMYVSMGHMININGFTFPLPKIFNPNFYPTNFALIQFILSTIVLFLGRKILTNGISSAFHKNPNMNTLVAVGSLTSFIYSVVLTFLIPLNINEVHNLYFESSAMILTFIMTGKFLESRSTEKTKSTIEALLSLTPDKVFILPSTWQEGENFNQATEVEIEKISIGDLILVKPGQRIALDGKIIFGKTTVDESMLTGESLPIEKNIDSNVTGGSLNQTGLIVIKVTAIGKDTTLAKIISFVEEAQGKKAPISKIADRVAGIFVPTVILIAIASAIIWIILGKDINFILRIFTSVLVIACPCALGLATPTAIMTGTGLGAKNGILVRSGESLENCGKINTVVFDKTGTITKGKPQVTSIFNCDDKTQKSSTEFLFSILASIEQASDHPLSKAIIEKANELQIDFSDYFVTDFENISGKGIKAELVIPDNNNTLKVFVGSKNFIEELGLSQNTSYYISNEISEKINEFENDGNTVICLATKQNENFNIDLIVGIQDEIRKESFDVIKKLHQKGIEVAMITGDSFKTAKIIAQKVGIDKIFARTMPEQKASIIQEFQKENKIVLMVGDGINDAAALVQADVGIAVGNGTDIAIESADIVLMKDGISDVDSAINLSRLTLRNIKQNLFWAFFYNSVSIPLAAGILYSSFGILLNPMIAGCSMALSSICVVLNALRLGTKKI